MAAGVRAEPPTRNSGAARVWNLKDGGKEATLHERWEFTIRNKRFPFPFDFDWHGRKRPVMTGAAFISGTNGDPKPKFVVTSSEDGKVKVWDLKTGTAVLDLKGHLGRVKSRAYNPLGKFFITAGEDDTVRIWEPCAEGLVDPKIGTSVARDNFKKYCETVSGRSH
ncbi:MAG: WD40 repeat domain-containing protein [Pyrinomonadaceae bacterium]